MITELIQMSFRLEQIKQRNIRYQYDIAKIINDIDDLIHTTEHDLEEDELQSKWNTKH